MEDKLVEVTLTGSNHMSHSKCPYIVIIIFKQINVHKVCEEIIFFQCYGCMHNALAYLRGEIACSEELTS